MGASPPPHESSSLSYLLCALHACVHASQSVIHAGRATTGTATSHETVRDVALTLCVTDRLLVDFVRSHRLAAAASCVCAQRLLTDLNASPAATCSDSRRLPPGGLVSLLYHMSTSLDSLSRCLADVAAARAPDWTYSATSTLARLALLAAALHTLLRGPASRMQRGARLLLALLAWRALSFLLPTSPTARLRAAHEHTLVLLRLWVCASDTFRAANMHRAGHSYALMLAYAEEHTDSLARRTLESVSLPIAAALWPTQGAPYAALKRVLDIMYCVTHAWHTSLIATASPLATAVAPLTLLTTAVFYALAPARVASHAAARILASADVGFISRVWNTTERGLGLGWPLDNLTVTVSRAVLRSLAPLSTATHMAGVPVHVTCPHRSPQLGDACEPPLCDEDVVAGVAPPILFYIHGGGFVGCMSASDHAWMTAWCRSAPQPCVTVYPLYTLAPEATFPLALNQLLTVYAHLRARCGPSRRIVIAGDSAGGNLATAVICACIAQRIVPPSAALLAYPALCLGDSPSASRALHLSDPLVPIALLQTVAAAYMGTPAPPTARCTCDRTLLSACGCTCACVCTCNRATSHLTHPLYAPESILAQFPPTHLCVGGLDPLLDDSVDFDTRLRRLRVPGALHVYRRLPHGFLMFPFLTHAAEAVQGVKDVLSDLAFPRDSAREAAQPAEQSEAAITEVRR